MAVRLAVALACAAAALAARLGGDRRRPCRPADRSRHRQGRCATSASGSSTARSPRSRRGAPADGPADCRLVRRIRFFPASSTFTPISPTARSRDAAIPPSRSSTAKPRRSSRARRPRASSFARLHHRARRRRLSRPDRHRASRRDQRRRGRRSAHVCRRRLHHRRQAAAARSTRSRRTSRSPRRSGWARSAIPPKRATGPAICSITAPTSSS